MKKAKIFSSILLPQDVIKTSETAAVRLGMTRSQFISHAIERALKQLTSKEEEVPIEHSLVSPESC